jgi:DNA-binding IclR family transcriptional regulator
MRDNVHPLSPQPDGAEEAKDRQFVTALARGLTILSCFSADRPELSGSEIARITGLPQPTVWRLCYTLLKTGMLVSTTADKMRPGLPVLRLGHSALEGLNSIDLARPHMQLLADEYRAACGLSVLHDLHMIFVERCEGQNQLLMNLRRGSAVQLASSALGWAYMAGLSLSERQEIFARLQASKEQNWAAYVDDFHAAMAHYKTHGYVLYKSSVFVSHNTVSVPVFKADGSVMYALNCGSHSASLSVKTLSEEVAPKLIALARMIETTIDP